MTLIVQNEFKQQDLLARKLAFNERLAHIISLQEGGDALGTCGNLLQAVRGGQE